MKILVLSHVDARWIKQRPQFMAEALDSAYGDVRFAYAWSYSRKRLTVNAMSCPLTAMFLVPQRLRGRMRLLDSLVQVFYAVFLGLVVRPSHTWVTHPRLGRMARVVVAMTNSELVYDFMDRTTEFSNSIPADIREETRLFERADLVVCSSETLARDVSEAGRKGKTCVLRNALAEPEAWSMPDKQGAPDGTTVLGYAGTISAWFDWEMLTKVLQVSPGWHLRLHGPVDNPLPPLGAQLSSLGVISHDELPSRLSLCDVLVMPFKMTRLIEAVDPVKGYEYIASGRPVVLPRYAETLHFEPFAALYEPSDAGDFQRAVQRAVSQRPSSEAIARFTAANTWRARMDSLERTGIFR